MSGERILVVDDEPAVLEACARVLRRHGYDVHTAAGGAEALSFIDHERFDLLLTDIRMPDVHGLELVDHARAVDPDLPCVVLTGYGSLDTAIDSIRVGVSGFVVKPFTLQELVRAVELPLQKARAARENVRLKALMPLFEVGQTLDRGSDFEALYEAILTAPCDGFGADACRLVLAPGSAPFLDAPTVVALPDRYAGHDALTDVAATVADWWPTVAPYFQIETQPLIVHAPDRTAAPQGADNASFPVEPWELAMAALEQAGMHDGIVVGLLASGQVMGALLVHQPHRATRRVNVAVAQLRESDREWLSILATLAGTALLRARLVDERAASEARLQMLFDAATCGLLTVDPGGQVRQANPMAEHILGTACGVMRGRAIVDVVPAVRDDGARVAEEQHPVIAALRSAHAVRGGVLQISRPDGQRRWLQTDAVPVLTPDGTLVQAVLSLVDVTPNRLAELQRDELAREQTARGLAEEAVRARDEFLTVAAHELRTPIASLHLAADIVVRALETEASGQPTRPTRLKTVSEVLAEQSTRMSRVVAQLLDLSRVDAGKLKLDCSRTDTVALVEDITSSARTLSDKHTIVVHAPSRPVYALIDSLRVEQVIWNLVDNAIKYSSPCSVIDITVARRSRGAVQLEVRNRGVGIAPDQLQHVFDRFYQASGTRRLTQPSGLGLGLYISQQIVHLHGGEITVHSPPDGDTRVVVSLPGVEPEP